MSKEVFSNIYQNYGFGSTESRSGPGSTIDETQKIIDPLISILQSLNINSVTDFPCGDLNWIKNLFPYIEEYTGCDIVDDCIASNKNKYPNKKFHCLDLSKDKIPTSDLLLVRDVIGHQPIDVGIKMLKNIIDSDCKFLLSTTWAKKNSLGFTPVEKGELDRENEGVEFGRFYPVNLMATPFNLPIPEAYIEESPVVDNYDEGMRKCLCLWDLSKVRSQLKLDSPPTTLHKKKETTIVTGIWNLDRESAGAGFKRSFNHYIENFKKLLKTDSPMIIFIESQHEHIVWENRSKENTFVINKEPSAFSDNSFPFYKEVQQIRNSEEWLSQAGWLRESTQATMDLYNPMVMSKMFMLNDARIFDPFDTDYFVWIDGGITNTVHEGYFTHDKVLDKIHNVIDKMLFISFSYKDGGEIHGFKRSEMSRYCSTDPQYVCRGGLFGGHKDWIGYANEYYYRVLSQSLSEGLMGTEESIFTIMSYIQPEIYNRFELEESNSGLIAPFFEYLKNYKPEDDKSKIKKSNSSCALYVLTFNSPQQFSKLISSFKQVPDFFEGFERKFVLDNSTDPSVFQSNLDIARQHGFELIKKNNLGICGGRQFIAEHFNSTDCEHMMFFEDDMFLNPPSESGYCKNGFRKYVDNILNKSIRIMNSEQLDFLKISFTEFFGDNRTQWSWYNVPQDIRDKYWPDYNKLPEHGLDPNAPLVDFEKMKIQEDLTFLTGDIYYANWPQVVSKKGNKKMFLETTWARPYEQTWMSHMFQLTKQKQLKSAVLLASPITHDRFIHYEPSERVES